MMSFRALHPTATSLTSTMPTPSLVEPATRASAKEGDMARAPDTRTRLAARMIPSRVAAIRPNADAARIPRRPPPSPLLHRSLDVLVHDQTQGRCQAGPRPHATPSRPLRLVGAYDTE